MTRKKGRGKTVNVTNKSNHCNARSIARRAALPANQHGKPLPPYLKERGAGAAASAMLAASTVHMSTTWHREVNRFSALLDCDTVVADCFRAEERAVSSKLSGCGVEGAGDREREQGASSHQTSQGKEGLWYTMDSSFPWNRSKRHWLATSGCVTSAGQL